MKKLLGAVLVVIVVAGGAAAWMYARVNQPYRGFDSAEQFVELPQGAGSLAIGQRLVDARIVRDLPTFRTALWMSGQGRHLKAGDYRFDRAMTPFEVIDKIARGDVFVITLTFPEGLTVAEMAKLFESHGVGPAAAFVAASKETSLVREIDPEAHDLEGYLFPETYLLSRHADAAKVIRMMVARFDHVFTPELRDAARARGLTVRQAVTLASIVEKETARPDERPLVAAVYTTRLRIGMPLQCDPTVIYGLAKAGRYDGNIHKADLSFDSPYNTYRYPGLPPGPIASPGRASLDAAVHPAAADYLYFVSRNDGSHQFARTLDEHNRNVHKYQIEYFRAQRGSR
jgi:peptidoglycan lytic transglycosylase G